MPADRATWLRRVAWLLAYWVAGVTALALVAGAIRLVMRAAGLAS